MALNWRSSCTLWGLQCENGLQYANFRVKCIFVVCRHHAKHHNVGQTAPSEAQKVTLESYKGVSRVQLGYRLVFVRKIAPFGVSPRFKSKVQIDVIKGHWSEIASKFV